jgi:hypothetical protein
VKPGLLLEGMAHDEVNQQAGAIVRPSNFMIFEGAIY